MAHTNNQMKSVQSHKSAREYAREIMVWAKKNFVYQDSYGLGVAEELGEWCHNLLKFRQKIRGYGDTRRQEKTEQFIEDQKDSIADAMIFLLHLAENNNTFLSFEEMDNFIRDHMHLVGKEITIVGMIMGPLAQVMVISDNYHGEPGVFRPMYQKMLNGLGLLAMNYCMDPVAECMEPVWAKVSQRDWHKYPKTGLPDERKPSSK